MENPPIPSLLTAGLALAMLGASALALTLPVSEDSSTSGNASVAKSAGRDIVLRVSAARQGLVRFEAGAFADGISAEDVSAARLVIFISGVSAPGALTLHRITQDWSEHGASMPAYDAKPLATIPQSSVVAKQFIIIDVTAAVQAWLREPGTDFGFAIAASGGARVLLGAKEGPAAGHPAQLQIEIAEGGRTRASASGPIGNFVTNSDIKNGAIQGKKLKTASVTATQLAADLTLGGTTTGAFNGSFTGSGADLTSLNAAQLSGTVPDARLGVNVALRGGGNTFSGNQIFNGGSIGVGTATPAAALHVAGGFIADGLRLEGNATSPNVIGGFNTNGATTGVTGASIGGGGQADFPNRILANFGTVGGGLGNSAGDAATIGGGVRSAASGSGSSIGGGAFNAASAETATIAGGSFNTASAKSAAIGGGSGNVASGIFSAIPGGDLNTATDSAFAAGHRAKAINPGSFVWADATDADFASTAANQFLIRAAGGVGIGTGSPAGKMHIVQPATAAATLHLQGGDPEIANLPTRFGLVFSHFGIGEAKHFITTTHSIAPANNQMTFWLNNNPVAGTTDTPGHGTTPVLTLSGAGQVFIGGDAIVTGGAVMTGGAFISRDGTAPGTLAGHAVIIKDTTDASTSVLALQSSFTGTHESATDNFITFFNAGGTSIGSIEGNGAGSVQLGGAGSDYAEYLPKADPGAQIEAAEIVGVRDGRIVARGAEADQFMVVTGQAIVAGNRPSEDAGDLAKRSLVSFIGQVPVRVRGAVKSGDYILASEKGDGTGVAMAAEAIAPSAMRRIVGRAWEASGEAGMKTVNTAVGLDQTGLAAPALERLEQENRELRAKLSALEARLNRLESALDRK